LNWFEYLIQTIWKLISDVVPHFLAAAVRISLLAQADDILLLSISARGFQAKFYTPLRQIILPILRRERRCECCWSRGAGDFEPLIYSTSVARPNMGSIASSDETNRRGVHRNEPHLLWGPRKYGAMKFEATPE
jgi:hypothetical protein